MRPDRCRPAAGREHAAPRFLLPQRGHHHRSEGAPRNLGRDTGRRGALPITPKVLGHITSCPSLAKMAEARRSSGRAERSRSGTTPSMPLRSPWAGFPDARPGHLHPWQTMPVDPARFTSPTGHAGYRSEGHCCPSAASCLFARSVGMQQQHGHNRGPRPHLLPGSPCSPPVRSPVPNHGHDYLGNGRDGCSTGASRRDPSLHRARGDIHPAGFRCAQLLGDGDSDGWTDEDRERSLHRALTHPVLMPVVGRCLRSSRQVSQAEAHRDRSAPSL